MLPNRTDTDSRYGSPRVLQACYILLSHVYVWCELFRIVGLNTLQEITHLSKLHEVHVILISRKNDYSQGHAFQEGSASLSSYFLLKT